MDWHGPGDWTREGSLQYVMERIGQIPDGGTGVLTVRYDPNCEIGVHYHGCDYCSIVVEGSITISEVTHKAGSMRFVKTETVYGPLIAGPEGCTMIDIFAIGDDPTSAANTYVDMERRRSTQPAVMRSSPLLCGFWLEVGRPQSGTIIEYGTGRDARVLLWIPLVVAACGGCVRLTTNARDKALC